MDPVTASLLISAGANIIGGLINRGGKKRRPELDLISPVVNAAQAQQSNLESAQTRRLQQLEADLARTGNANVTGTAAREQLFRVGAEEQNTVRGMLMDRILEAGNAQKMADFQRANMEFDDDARRRQAIAQGFSSIGDAASQFMSMRAMTQNSNLVGSPSGVNAAAVSMQQMPQSAFAPQSQVLSPQSSLNTINPDLQQAQVGVGMPRLAPPITRRFNQNTFDLLNF